MSSEKINTFATATNNEKQAINDGVAAVNNITTAFFEYARYVQDRDDHLLELSCFELGFKSVSLKKLGEELDLVIAIGHRREVYH